MALIENIGYLLIGFIALVSVFLIVLALLEKKLHMRFLSAKYARNDFYIKRISRIRTANPNEGLRELSKVAKEFFREAFHTKGNPDYSELQKYFFYKNNRKATRFCGEIVRFMYSNEKITNEKLRELVQTLAEIVSSNKIITKEQKKELDKKSQKNQAPSILRKIHISGVGKKKHQDQKNQSRD